MTEITGEIIDRRHELSGAIVTGRIFVFPQGKGSSTSSAVLLESIKSGIAPAAIINLKVDPILALGAFVCLVLNNATNENSIDESKANNIVADELYHQTVPIVVLPEDAFYSIKEGDYIAIEHDGKVRTDLLRKSRG